METPEKKESSTFMDKNTRRLLMMIFMVLGYCFAEIIVGYSAFKNFGPTTSIWSFFEIFRKTFGQLQK